MCSLDPDCLSNSNSKLNLNRLHKTSDRTGTPSGVPPGEKARRSKLWVGNEHE